MKNYIISILTMIALSASVAHAAAYNDAGTDYTTETVDGWIDMGPAMEPLNFTDFLVCIMKKSGADKIVNGTYNALADTAKCQTGQGSSKPEIAKMTVVSSRADNSSPQKVKVWFDAGSTTQYIVDVTVTEGVSSSAPYGSFTFSWQNANDAAEKGTMSFTAGSSSTSIKMYKNERTIQWVNGAVANDKTTGQAVVGVGVDSYGLSFNKDAGGFVNIQKNSDAAKCYDRDNLSEYVFGYTLYDPTTGAKKNLTGPFQCTYDSSGTTKNCHIGPYGGWFEGGETNITSITHEDGTEYTGITYDPTDANNDGIYITIPSYTFDPPINFDKTAQTNTVKTAMGSNAYLQYYGPRDLYGLPWLCSDDGVTYVQSNGGNCDSAISWRPGAKLADGTVLTDIGSNTFVTKAKVTMKVMATAPGMCSALPLTDVVTTYPALTSSDITDVTSTWADKPTVTAAPRVIEGVVQ